MSRTYSIVIVGRPNVGKSTLFNRLLGRRKALVHDLPGVTRDRNVAVLERGDAVVQIVDTGGVLGETEDMLSGLVEEQVNIAIAGGDFILHVVDAKDGMLPLDRELARRLIQSGKQCSLVVNKVDVPAHIPRSAEFHALGIEPVFPLSAEHGIGMEELWDYIDGEIRALGVEPPSPASGARIDPIKVAIVGRPNVGKSSIMNRLLGEDRSLVSDIPGTTRDPVDSYIRTPDRDFILVDTAGIRRKSKTGRGAEILSVILARRSLEQCHVALLVVDASQPPSHQDAHIAGLIEGARRGAILVLNKWDLIGGEENGKRVVEAFRDKLTFIDWLPIVRTSAKTKRHVERILPHVQRVYERYAQTFPTAALNKTLGDLVARVSPPSVQGKEFKIRYATQTGKAPPILTLFTNSRFPPPDAYTRYLKNRMREIHDLEGSPLILKYRKE